MIRHSRLRPAFTLVELLVALALGIALLALAVAVSQSSAFDSYKVVGSGDRLSQWMLIAKNRALRDKAPRGIRLIPDPNNPNLVREVVYIEQPEPWVPAANQTITAASPRLIVQRVVAQSPPPPGGAPGDSTRVFLINVPSPTGIIQDGDTLFLPELGQSFQVNVSTTPATDPNNPAPQVGSAQWPPPPTPAANSNVTWSITSVVELILAAPGNLGQSFGAGYAKTDPAQSTTPTIIAPTYQTTNFAIYRQARPLLGLPTEQLPSGMAIDIAASLNPPPPDALNNRDILFAPSGEQIRATGGIVALLLRDTNLLPAPAAPLTTDYPKAGQMILVCLYPGTGAISTQPPNPPPAADPYQFAKDGINTGL